MSNAKPKIRLYVPGAFAADQSLALSPGQSHYVSHVMRASQGDSIAVFNGTDGEWLAEVTHLAKKAVTVQLTKQLHPQKSSADIWLIFAPIKNKTDIVVEKAVELGVAKLGIVYTQHAVVKSINHEKLEAHAIEAAEQCERHDVPAIEEFKDIPTMLSTWPSERTLLFADESGNGEALKTLLPTLSKGSYAILIGPEGGFSDDERRMLNVPTNVKTFSLGPRILRADTAAAAALACVQSWLGDWA